MKKTMYVKLAGVLCIGSLCQGMQQSAQAPTLEQPDIWVQYQELSQLTEEQQRLLIALAQKSTVRETEELLLASQAVVKSSPSVIEGLRKAKTIRDDKRAWRRWRLFDTDIKLSADITELTPEQILGRLSTVSSLDEKAIEEMVAQAPQAKTKDLQELIKRFETIQEQLTKFIVLVESLKTTREQERLETEKKSASAVEELKKEAAAKPAEADSCIIC